MSITESQDSDGASSLRASSSSASYLLPSFLQRLADPSIKTVLVCGCGGGFDFVHSLTLYPELKRMGKEVVIGSYSFGDPYKISNAATVFDEDGDSLMTGEEEGLGDPIEDAVSVATVASLRGVKARLLISVGLGTDRFNHVSDAASLRAIAELTRSGGFLGAVSLEPDGQGSRFYKNCLQHIYQQQGFRSVLACTIAASVEGCFGRDEVPAGLRDRVRSGQLYLWPIMAIFWGFDVEVVAQRSRIAGWIRECHTVDDCYRALSDGRRRLGAALRDVENLPRHEEMRR